MFSSCSRFGMGAREMMIPKWTEDVGEMKAAGVELWENCDTCRHTVRLDLDALIAAFGPRFSLWNRQPRCHHPGCGGRLWFRAQPRNAFHKILLDAPAPEARRLHARWCATLHADYRDHLPLLPMLEATDRVAIAGCGRCELLFYISRISLAPWIGARSMAQAEERLRCAGGPPVCELAIEMFPRELVPPGKLDAL
jgi:hypothetical protein